MKIIFKNIIAILIIFLVFGTMSCSKSTFSHKYHKKRSSNTARVEPAKHKSEPVRKKYYIPAKKKAVLGQQKAKI